jgi:hypothetical protein
MKPAALTTALRHYGVDTRQVWAQAMDGETRNRRGVIRAEVARRSGRAGRDRPVGLAGCCYV